MQVGNNRPIGPKPNDHKSPPLDPDLTKVNRDGVEYTQKHVSEQTNAARTEAAERQEVARLENESAETAKPVRGDLSRETVDLSAQSRRLAAEEHLGPKGESESTQAREARLGELRQALSRGELNSPERLRTAAGRLLGGD